MIDREMEDVMDAASATKKRLHLGCGTRHLDGWVNVDAVAGTNVDVACNLNDLWLFEPGSAEWIYASHVIEHLYADKLPGVLANLHRILAPGGKLTLATISLEGIYRNAFEKGYAREAVNAYIYGDAKSTDGPWQMHRQVFTEKWLTDSLHAAGFPLVRPWQLTQYPEIAALQDCAASSWHVTLYLEAVK